MVQVTTKDGYILGVQRIPGGGLIRRQQIGHQSQHQWLNSLTKPIQKASTASQIQSRKKQCETKFLTKMVQDIKQWKTDLNCLHGLGIYIYIYIYIYIHSNTSLNLNINGSIASQNQSRNPQQPHKSNPEKNSVKQNY